MVTSTSDLFVALRYITSNQEYERISKSTNVRSAVERFWIDAAGDRERGREAIRIYYGRVRMPTDTSPQDPGVAHGSRTGPHHFRDAHFDHKNDLNETHGYGEENNLMSLTFTFTKTPRGLQRQRPGAAADPMLKGAWYRNVESWQERAGISETRCWLGELGLKKLGGWGCALDAGLVNSSFFNSQLLQRPYPPTSRRSIHDMGLRRLVEALRRARTSKVVGREKLVGTGIRRSANWPWTARSVAACTR
ncbi:MAG: hypothetical protein IPH63_12990 [Flavobacteriales bacterium]|nr:hypothetical protein [Flavobacteriales bacterium]